MMSEICTQRHHVGLFRKIRENLPRFFGFEAVGILMYNFEEDQFFSNPGHDHDQDDDDNCSKKSDEDLDNEEDAEGFNISGSIETFNTLKSKSKNKSKKKIPSQKDELTEKQKEAKIIKTHN